MKKLIIIIILITAAGSLHVLAQRSVHEFSVYGGGGLSTLNYQLSSGNRNVGLGGDFGLGYTWCQSRERVTATGAIFRENWGIYTGVGLGMYNAKAKLDAQKTLTKNLTDNEGDQFEMLTSFDSYTEKQSAMFLSIPVMGQFQIRQYYVMGGFKLAIPVNAKYSSKNATLANEGYYIHCDNVIDAPEFQGFGTFARKNFDGTLDLGTTLMLALEGGMKWRLTGNFSLFTGVYFDYGLNNSFKGGNKSFIKYYPGEIADFSTNSVLYVFADKVKMMAAGIKLRLSFEM